MEVVAIGLILLFTNILSPLALSSPSVKDRMGNPINSEAHGKFVMAEVNRCKKALPKCHGMWAVYSSGRCECRDKK